MSNFVGCWNFIEEGGKEGEEKRRLDRKIFEGVEVILSSGAKMKNLYLLIDVVYKIESRRRRFIVF